jgi:tripartite-type tricarboxylate transporter receptor subunit TctC
MEESRRIDEVPKLTWGAFALTLGIVVATAVLATTTRPARAEYPSRPVTLVVGYAAGGAVDAAARVIAEHLQKELKQTVLIENRPGSGSMIASNYVAKAQPDGYTLLCLDAGTILARWLNKRALFDALRDFEPISLVAKSPLVLFAHPSVPFSNLSELIHYARANPGKLGVGTAGVGTPHHLAAAWLNVAAQITIEHIPYRGAAPALQDLLGGQIPLMWAGPASAMPFLAERKVKALAVSTQQRDPLLQDVPAVSELGYGFDITTWVGIAAPANTSPEVIARMGEAIRTVAALPAVQQRMRTYGFHIDARNSSEFRAMMTAEYWKYGDIVKAADIAPE